MLTLAVHAVPEDLSSSLYGMRAPRRRSRLAAVTLFLRSPRKQLGTGTGTHLSSTLGGTYNQLGLARFAASGSLHAKSRTLRVRARPVFGAWGATMSESRLTQLIGGAPKYAG